MASAFIGGAALGAAFGEVLKAVLESIDRACKFDSILKRIASNLRKIEPVFDEIENLNRLLDRPKEETDGFIEMLKKSENLIRRCSKIKWWNYCKRPSYAKKLLELEDSIVKFFQIDVQVQLYRDVRQILVHTKENDFKLHRKSLSLPIGGRDCDPSAILGCCEAPGVSGFIVGMDWPLQQLKMKLLETGDSVVVLSAPGGCGKTTLAKLICHDHEIRRVFDDNIFFVTVSKLPNLQVIIKKLFQHKGYVVPEFQNDEDAINQLENLLKKIVKNSLLLVLDDVWSGSEHLIEKFEFDIPGYKILVTSRSVFPRFDSTYKMKMLNDQYAMNLFHHSAFRQGGSSRVSNDLVKKVVRGCCGCPLVLTVVGRALCGQPEVVWKRTVKQWSEGQSIFDIYSNTDLLSCLKTSIDALDEGSNMKDCYMDLGSFPEDERIPVTVLKDMWEEMYNFDEDGEEALYVLHELSSRNLLNLVATRKETFEAESYDTEQFVTQHDLLRDLAIYLSSQESIQHRKNLIVEMKGNSPPKWLVEEMAQPLHARLLSISADETLSSSWNDLQLPEVEVLILNFRTRIYTLPMFMTKMDQLKVLIITNYGGCPAKISNFTLLNSLPRLRRIRLEHISISSLGESTSQLRNLRKISLIMCEIGNAFNTIQIPQMMPNIVEIEIDCCNDLVKFPEGFCDLHCLKKLSITNCHELSSLPEGLGKLENLEVLRLHASTELFKLPESIGSLHRLSFIDISDCLNLEQLPPRIGSLCGLTEVIMSGCCELLELPPSVKDLRKLENVICDEETAALWERFRAFHPNLRINILKEDVNLNWLPNCR